MEHPGSQKRDTRDDKTFCDILQRCPSFGSGLTGFLVLFTALSTVALRKNVE